MVKNINALSCPISLPASCKDRGARNILKLLSPVRQPIHSRVELACHTIEYMRLFLVEVERGNEPELYTLLVVLLTLTSSQEQKKRGVITASAGNHAVALAYHGRQLNIPVTVVLPTNAPKVKVRIVYSRL